MHAQASLSVDRKMALRGKLLSSLASVKFHDLCTATKVFKDYTPRWKNPCWHWEQGSYSACEHPQIIVGG